MCGPWSSRHWPRCWFSEWPLRRGSLRRRTWAAAVVSAEAVVVLGLVEELAPVVDLVEGLGMVEVLAAGLEVEKVAA